MRHQAATSARRGRHGLVLAIRIGDDAYALRIEGVQADSRLMQVVFENLIGNAWKFTGKVDEAHIEFGVEARDEGSVFLVRDNGAGFDMAHADTLFAPFRRLHRDKDFPGTGIGLATERRVIDRHGGRVWAEGAVGRGATVFFTVPTPGR